jgi:hypothetical protein
MSDALKDLGGVAVGFALFVGLLPVAIAFIRGGVWLTLALYPFLIELANGMLTLAILLLRWPRVFP